MTTEQFEINARRCGLNPVFGGLAKPVMCWRGLDYYSAFDRHAYLHTTADGVTHATLRDDEPLSRLHGSITKPLEEVTDIDFIKILGMKPTTGAYHGNEESSQEATEAQSGH